MGKIIEILKLKCQKCGHEWAPRQADVRICPNCKTTYWDEKKHATA